MEIGEIYVQTKGVSAVDIKNGITEYRYEITSFTETRVYKKHLHRAGDERYGARVAKGKKKGEIITDSGEMGLEPHPANREMFERSTQLEVKNES